MGLTDPSQFMSPFTSLEPSPPIAAEELRMTIVAIARTSAELRMERIIHPHLQTDADTLAHVLC